MRKKTLIFMIVFSVLVVTSYPCWAQIILYIAVLRSRPGVYGLAPTPDSCKSNEAFLSGPIQDRRGFRDPRAHKGYKGRKAIRGAKDCRDQRGHQAQQALTGAVGPHKELPGRQDQRYPLGQREQQAP